MITKSDAEAMEQAIEQMSEREYNGLLGWLAGGCEGPLWHCIQSWAEESTAEAK